MEKRKTIWKKELRTERFNFRLTEEESKLFREKAKKYPNLTALIVDAVLNFDVRKGRNRIDTMIKFSDDISKFDNDIARLGNNVNQIARVLNQYKMERIELNNISFLSFIDEVGEVDKLLQALLVEIRKLSNM